MQLPTPLSNNAEVLFRRDFDVEALRGGMNRLLLRALPTEGNPTRVEVLFQYVQYLQLPMRFDDLEIRDVTSAEDVLPSFSNVLQEFPACRVFRLKSKGQAVGTVIAAACSFGEDQAPSGAPSMFPMM